MNQLYITLVTRQIDNTPPGDAPVGGISPWLLQGMQTWTRSHQTFMSQYRIKSSLTKPVLTTLGNDDDGE